MASIYLWSSIS